MSEKLEINYSYRAHAIVNVDSTYMVDKKAFEALIADGHTVEEAFEEIRSENDCECTHYESDIDDIIQVHESEAEIA